MWFFLSAIMVSAAGDDMKFLSSGLPLVAIVKIAGAGLAFLFHVIMARLIGGEEYGVFSYCLSVALLLAIPAKMGFDTGTLRFLPALTVGEPGLVSSFIRFSGIVVLVASLAVSVIALLSLIYMVEIAPSVMSGLLVVIVLLPLRSSWDLCRARLQAYGKLGFALAPALIALPVLTTIIIYQLDLVAPVDASIALGVQGAVTFVLYVFCLSQLPRTTTSSVAKSDVARSAIQRGWLRTSALLCLTSSVQIIYGQSDILVLGTLLSPSEVGGYAAAAKVAVLAAFGLEIVNFRYAPLIAKAYASGPEALQEIITTAVRRVLLFTIPASLFVFIMADKILLLFGSEFSSEVALPLRILIVGQLVNALSGPVGFVCSMTRLEADLFRVSVASMILNVVANIILISYYGVIGAAIATAFSMAMRNIVLMFVVEMKLGVSMRFWRRVG